MCYYEASEKEYEYVSYRILPSIMELRHAKAFRPLNPTAVRWDPNLHQDGQSAPIWLSELLKKTLQGLEPWIFGFEDQRRIHWAIAPIRESIETAKSVVIWGVLASLYNAINAPLQTVACQKRLDGQKIEVYNDLRLNNRRRKCYTNDKKKFAGFQLAMDRACSISSSYASPFRWQAYAIDESSISSSDIYSKWTLVSVYCAWF